MNFVGTESHEVRFKAGDIIFCEFEPGEELYIIKEGKVRITKIQGGKEKTIDVIGPGEIFGEMALIDNEKRTATVIAETDVTLIRVDKNNFEYLAKTNVQWAMKLIKIFARRIYDAKRKLRILSIADPDARLLETLIMLGEPLTKPDSNRVELNVDVEEVAHWSGLPLRDCQEVINRYVRMGKLDIESGKIVIVNISDLKRIAQSKSKLA